MARATPAWRHRATDVAFVAALLGGLALVGSGLWIPAKALLAQHLLDNAWSRAQAGELAPRPWAWADLSPVARLFVPSTGDRLLVLSDASGRTLAFGPGHLPNTAAPGAAGNTVIAGHRDTQFGFLGELPAGAFLELEDAGGARHRYRVDGARVTHEDDASVTALSSLDTLTLVTCWPLDAVQPGTPWRYVVTARRVEPPAGRAPEPPRQVARRLLR